MYGNREWNSIKKGDYLLAEFIYGFDRENNPILMPKVDVSEQMFPLNGPFEGVERGDTIGLPVVVNWRGANFVNAGFIGQEDKGEMSLLSNTLVRKLTEDEVVAIDAD